MTTGTCYFPTLLAARIYYKPYNPDLHISELTALVKEKVKSAEIIIGDPPLKDGQTKKLIDYRWHICE
jgi:hypothetical protein